MLRALNDLKERHKRLEVESINEADRLKHDILAATRSISSETCKRTDLDGLKTQLDSLERESWNLRMALNVLESLHFPTIESRRANIAAAHASIYEWIFRDTDATGQPNSRFVQWLRSNKDIYWINGKAGSGKSTLI